MAALTLTVFAAGIFAAPLTQDKKLTPEELIARHVESIGSPEARASARSRVVKGTIMLAFRVGGAGSGTGTGTLASTGSKVWYGMKFNAIEYTGENLVFDGKRAATGFLPNGGRSQLSSLLSIREAPLKEGLLGGALSTAWPFLRIEEQNPKLEYRGLKKIDGREMHELSYRPRKGDSDLKITLYFDGATFRHIRTRYSLKIEARIGTRESPNQNPESYYSLTEDFDDFRAVDGLMLPHKYRLQVSVQGSSASSLYDYTLAVNSISHKETIDDRVFTLK
ncbi:MAG TPA: hypothetical protein VJX74_07360 [Blastocatellia bacterium]|nr:hypothetical protein [Blastocatellia bacterium]